MVESIEEGATYALPNGEKVLAEFYKAPQKEWDGFTSKTMAGSPCPVCGESFEEDEGVWKLHRLGPIPDTHEPIVEGRPGGAYVGDPTPRYYIVDDKRELQLLPEGAPDHCCDFCGTVRYAPKSTSTPYTIEDLKGASHE